MARFTTITLSHHRLRPGDLTKVQSEENRSIVEQSAAGTGSQSSSEVSPEEDRPLPDTPEAESREIERVMSASLQMMGTAIPAHPLAEKITSDHITTLIDNSLTESSEARADSKHSRLTYILFAGFVIIAAIALTIALVVLEETSLVREVFPIAAALGTGFLGGYGIGYVKSSRDR